MHLKTWFVDPIAQWIDFFIPTILYFHRNPTEDLAIVWRHNQLISLVIRLLKRAISWLKGPDFNPQDWFEKVTLRSYFYNQETFLVITSWWPYNGYCLDLIFYGEHKSDTREVLHHSPGDSIVSEIQNLMCHWRFHCQRDPKFEVSLATPQYEDGFHGGLQIYKVFSYEFLTYSFFSKPFSPHRLENIPLKFRWIGRRLCSFEFWFCFIDIYISLGLSIMRII